MVASTDPDRRVPWGIAGKGLEEQPEAATIVVSESLRCSGIIIGQVGAATGRRTKERWRVPSWPFEPIEFMPGSVNSSAPKLCPQTSSPRTPLTIIIFTVIDPLLQFENGRVACPVVMHCQYYKRVKILTIPEAPTSPMGSTSEKAALVPRTHPAALVAEEVEAAAVGDGAWRHGEVRPPQICIPCAPCCTIA